MYVAPTIQFFGSTLIFFAQAIQCATIYVILSVKFVRSTRTWRLLSHLFIEIMHFRLNLQLNI